MSTCLGPTAVGVAATCLTPGSATPTCLVPVSAVSPTCVISPPIVVNPPTPDITYGPGGVSITRQCRTKTSTTEVPGIDEFVETESPKRYRRKTITGTMRIREYTHAGCASNYQGSGGQSGEFPVFYFFNEYAIGSVSVQLNSINPATGICNYTLVSADWVNRDPPGGYLHRYQDPNEPPGYFATSWFPSPAVGTSFNVAAGDDFAITIAIQAISGYGIGSWYYTAGDGDQDDFWNIEDTVQADGSLLRTIDIATRTYPWGTVSDISDVDVSTFYNAAHTIVWNVQPTYTSQVVTGTTRTITGLGCVAGLLPWEGGGPGSMNATGVVVEQLHDEITPEETVVTATDTIESWTDEDTCSELVASIVATGQPFEYDFTSAQTRVVLGTLVPLIVGQSYSITVKFARRLAGTSDDFEYLDGADEVITFTATSETYTSDWIDFPNLAGYETQLESITVEFV